MVLQGIAEEGIAEAGDSAAREYTCMLLGPRCVWGGGVPCGWSRLYFAEKAAALTHSHDGLLQGLHLCLGFAAALLHVISCHTTPAGMIESTCKLACSALVL